MTDPEIIIYGGTFDPPHRGHIDCMKNVIQRFPGALVVIVPGLRPAGVYGKHKDPLLNFETRFELCRLAFVVDANFKNVELSSIEQRLPIPNYTLNTINKIQEKYSNKRIAIILGLDQFQGFCGWNEPSQILRCSDLILINRGKDSGSRLKEEVETQIDKLGHKINWFDQELAFIDETSTKIFLIGVETSIASSSEIRNYLSEEKKVPEGWLSPSVECQIISNRLYLAKGKEE